MEKNYDQLLFDWNRQFVPSRNCFKSNDDNIIYPDSVYVNRLYALPTLMEMAYNQVTRSYIEMYTGKKRTQVEYMLARGKYFFPIFEQALDKYNIPMELKYLPVIESALNPTALSRAGASGLWQFMAPTGKRYDLEVNSLVDERRDPVKASEAAAHYLKDMYNIYGDWNLVIAAYNCGPGNVNKAIRRSGGKKDYWEIYPYLPRETRGYVPAFIAANYVMNYYKYHNLCPLEYSEKENTDTIHVNKSLHLQQIASVLNIPIEKVREMNPQFKNDIIPGEFKSYAVCLPTKKVCDFITLQDSIYAYRADEFLVHRKIVNYATAPVSEFVTKTTYHNVRRGESLAEVARLYGVSSNELKRWNGLRSNRVKPGRRLAIRTQVRVRSAEPAKESESGGSNSNEQAMPSNGMSIFARLQSGGQASNAQETNLATDESDDNADSSSDDSDNVKNIPAEKVVSKKEVKPKNVRVAQVEKQKSEVAPKAKEKEAKSNVKEPIHHKVVSGENINTIAQQYNVSVEDISNWNNLKKNKVKKGQDLIVYSPEKQVGHLAMKSDKKAAPIHHKVKAGENLGRIADQYNVSQEDIKKWNNMDNSVVKIGQDLVVYSSGNQDSHYASKEDKSAPVYHKVKSGENLGKIAEQYHVSQEDIKEWNNMTSSVVKVGQQLIVSNNEVSDKKIANNEVLNKKNLRKSTQPHYYSVKKGDTLMSIAEKYSYASVREIKLANNLKSDVLNVGQKLMIPASR